MEIKTATANGKKIAIIQSAEKLITDIESALDLIMTVSYEAATNRVAVDKSAVAEDFFILSTGVAGEILQKFVNYHVKFAVYGDFSAYTSKPLKDFIYESNKGNSIFFASDEEDAIRRLSEAK